MVRILRQELRMILGFVAKGCGSRKEVERNDGDYLDGGRNRRNFAPVSYLCLVLVN